MKSKCYVISISMVSLAAAADCLLAAAQPTATILGAFVKVSSLAMSCLHKICCTLTLAVRSKILNPVGSSDLNV